MRRKDREIVEAVELLSIIEQCDVIRIAMIDEGRPYIVPLNFGVDNKEGFVFYFHSASDGRKINVLRKNPSVCFELDSSFQVISGEAACMWSAEYTSIIGYGMVSCIEDHIEKVHAMDCIMRKYGHVGEPNYYQAVFSKTMIYKLVVNEITGKKNTNL